MSAVRIASIARLCAADHDDDPATIAAWIGNKDAKAFRILADDPKVLLLVAETASSIVGVAAASECKITLNYVHPDHRFAGVSTSLLLALETELATRGYRTITLESTATALPFYQSRGWSIAGPGSRDAGYPMTKEL